MRNKKKNFPTKTYMRFLIFVVMSSFAFFFRIKKQIPVEVRNVKPPYLLLSNHVGFWDPFIVGNFLPHYTRFVSSDAAFRNPVFKFFLTRLGTIPKKKNMRDSQVIRDVVSVIRQGDSVGIFPEAVRNWNGSSFPVDKSIIKLVKLLKVPVIVPILKGMNLFNPRWSPHLRRTKVEVDYTLLATAEEVKNLSEDELFSRLRKTLVHDEVEHQRKNKNIIRSDKRAEYINHALFVCPQCNSIDSFSAKGNDFGCNNCACDIHIDKFGFFNSKTGKKLRFDNIRDWYLWQEKWLLKFVDDKVKSGFTDVVFSDKNSKVYHTETKGKPIFIGEADIKLFTNRIEIIYSSQKEDLIINFDDLQTINPQVSEMLEIFYKGEAYRVIGSKTGVSALKWEIALNAIWQLNGQHNKLSTYIDSGWLNDQHS